MRQELFDNPDTAGGAGATAGNNTYSGSGNAGGIISGLEAASSMPMYLYPSRMVEEMGGGGTVLTSEQTKPGQLHRHSHDPMAIAAVYSAYDVESTCMRSMAVTLCP